MFEHVGRNCSKFVVFFCLGGKTVGRNSSKKNIKAMLLYCPAMGSFMEVKNGFRHCTSHENYKNEECSIV